MKKATLLVSIVLLILVFSSSASAEAELSIPDASFDFGFVPQHSKISHVFWLYSVGTDSLYIKRVRPG